MLRSEQRFGEEIAVVPDNETVTGSNRRSSKFARTTEHVPQQIVVGGSFRRQIEVKRRFPLRHIQVLHAVQHGERSRSLDGVLARALDLSVGDFVLLEKLSSAFAACSARAVVPPLQTAGHKNSSGSDG